MANKAYKEFIVYDKNGKEIDWVSPVKNVKKTDKIYVNNGIAAYDFPLDTNYKIVEIEG